ncbi:Kinase [Mycena indigotica]|uniref:Kinase n=1 Tax=Mycena indigotica TaxID=2126181 RepID=A0A8H6SLZ8_9AGAR|nr:Kinase [Mycena indigotica]KAF7301789.1 Kinase [Mycena indigotica]
MSSVASTDSEAPSTHSLTSQVGGHANGVLTTEDDTLLIKQALPVELQFYRTVAASTEPAIDALRPYLPKFLGTLTLEGEFDPDKPTTETSIPVKPIATNGGKESLVLENLTHPFTKPNVLDVKLGTVLYDETASPEKVARMLKAAENTTSLKTGIRLTGFQAYGKSITKEQLPEGFARVFPVLGVGEHGALPSQGLPAGLLLQILELLREDVQEIRDAFAQVELRMIGGSLLFIYESDATRAEEGLKWMLRDLDEEDSESDEDESKPPKPGPAYDVRLIDFAHTRFVPGQGPDEGVLLGLDTILAQLDQRIHTITTQTK